MSNVGYATLQVIPSFKGAQVALAQGIGGPASAAGATAGKGFGAAFKKALVPLAIAAGVLFAAEKIGAAFDEVFDTIRIGTGATGKTLTGLKNDFKKVISTVPTDFASASLAITGLNQRLDLTGPQLQKRSEQILELSRLTKTDLGQNIVGVTRLFGDWGVATEHQGSTLDKLFRASQATGVGIDQLASQVVFFGSPLRQLGFTLDESVALLSKWEKEGVNVETVLGGMRQSVGKLAAPTDQFLGKLKEFPGLTEAFGAAPDTASRFQVIKDKLLELFSAGDKKSKLEAAGLAMEAFGRRAGADVVAAFGEGRFAIGKLFDEVATGKDTIRDAAKDTNDWREQWTIFKNRILVKLQPIFAGIFTGIGAAMDFFGTKTGKTILKMVAVGVAVLGMVIAFKKVIEVFKLLKLAMMTNPFTAIAVAVAAIAVLVIDNWDAIKASLSAAWEWIKTTATSVWTSISEFFSGIWAGITGVFNSAVDGVKGVWNGLIEFLAGLPDLVFQTLLGVGTKIVNAIIGALNSGIDLINDIIPNNIGLPDPIPDINLPNNPIPRIPKLHSGGIFRAPNGSEGLAFLQDGERVLSRQQSLVTPAQLADSAPMRPIVYSPTYNIKGNGDEFLEGKMRRTLNKHDRELEMTLRSFR